LECDFSAFKSRGQVWLKYQNSEQAHDILLENHQKNFHGASLIVRFELGVDSNGKRIVDMNCHHTIIRSVQLRKGIERNSHTQENLGVSYTHRSLFCGETEYPFPTGLYLTRIIQLTNIFPPHNPLLALLRDTSYYGNKYSKEMSECMAMADCTQRAVRMVTGYCCSVYDTPSLRHPSPAAGNKDLCMPCNVTVYVLGDGVRPLCAAAICLHIPPQFNWKYVSIDPLMDISDLALGDYSHCLHAVKGFSQDYSIPSNSPSTASSLSEPPLSIVIACHSHAPLSEFWDRVSCPKIAIVMACCADYAELPGIKPIFQFSDYEVYSPKRKIKIFTAPATSPSVAVAAYPPVAPTDANASRPPADPHKATK
jgi:hypothetical protein